MKPSIWPRLKSVSQSLYVHLLHLSQIHSREFHTLTDVQIAEATGVSIKSVPTARDQLQKMKLVTHVRETKGHQYRVLDPATGRPLAKIEDFNALSPELIENFFLDRLRGYDPFRDDNGLRAICPFHIPTKSRKRDLSVKLSNGGVWHCFDKGCDKAGKLVEFERLLAMKNGPAITVTEAAHSVRNFFAEASRKRIEQESMELDARRAMM